jgi:hypothetical protein
MTGNVNGQNFSWGPGGWDSRTSAADYNKHQTDELHRDGKGVVLDLTPLEEVKLAACLRSKSGGTYNGVTNNCGNPLLSCLEALGIADSTNKRRVLPVDVLDIISKSPRAIGQTVYSAPGNSSFDTPPVWPLVDSIRRKLGF